MREIETGLTGDSLTPEKKWPMTFSWRGVPAKDMTHDELCEALLEMHDKNQRLNEENTRLNIDAIWVIPKEHRSEFRRYLMEKAK